MNLDQLLEEYQEKKQLLINIIRDIIQRLKLSRKAKIELLSDTEREILSDRFDYFFEGHASINGEIYRIKCYKWGFDKNITLEYIIKEEEPLKESVVRKILKLQEAFEQYQYYPSIDKEELMFDFFLIASLPHPENEELDYVLEEIRKDFYPWMKQEMLKAVLFSISSEFRHIFDSNSDEKLKEYFQYMKQYSFIQKYVLYYSALTGSHSTIIDVPRIRAEFSENSGSRKLAYKAMKQSGVSEEKFVEIARDAFLGVTKDEDINLRWSSAYGGEPWSNICDAWLKLYNSTEAKDIVIYVDHMYDLQHNTNTVFNKLQSYYKESEYRWIAKALDYKYNTEHLYDLFGLVSPDLKQFAAAIIKSATGETLEAWLKKGGSETGYKDIENFYPGDDVEYIGPRKELRGLKGKIINKSKGSFDVEFIKPELKEADQKILVKGILPKYLKKIVSPKFKEEEVFGKFNPGDKEIKKSENEELISFNGEIFKVGDKVQIIDDGKVIPSKTDDPYDHINTTGLVGAIKSLLIGEYEVSIDVGTKKIVIGVDGVKKVSKEQPPTADQSSEKVSEEGFKVGDKIVCIAPFGKKYLTKNKEYKVVNTYPKSEKIVIIADDGKQHEYKARRFELVSEKLQKFAEGDEVEILKGENKGKQGRIEKIDFTSPLYYYVLGLPYQAQELKLVEEQAEVEKSTGEFKVGDIVKVLPIGDKVYSITKAGSIGTIEKIGIVTGNLHIKWAKVTGPTNLSIEKCPHFVVDPNYVEKISEEEEEVEKVTKKEEVEEKESKKELTIEDVEIGDKVKLIVGQPSEFLTVGKTYRVKDKEGEDIVIKDDEGVEIAIEVKYFEKIQ